METVTISTARGFDVTDFVLFGISAAAVIGLIAWHLVTRTNLFRDRG